MSTAKNAPNPGLRGADWRFLLPQPPGGTFRHLVLLGGSSALAQRLSDEGVADRVTCVLPHDRSADALIIFAGADVPLQQACAALRADGFLYWEVTRPSPLSPSTTPARLKQSLAAHGLTPLGTYWVSPSFAERQVYLPLEARHALGWYLTTLHTAGTPLARLQEPALHALARSGNRPFAFLAPRYAVTAVAGTDVGEPFVLQHPTLPEAWRQTPLHPLVLTGGDDERSRVVVLPFTPTSDHPIGVLKVARTPTLNAYTDVEQAILDRLRPLAGEALQPSIPERIATFRTAGLAVNAEAYLPGRRVASTSGRWRFPGEPLPDDLEAATTWLIRFHRQTEIRRVPFDAEERARWVETPLAAYTSTFGTTPEEAALFRAVIHRAESLAGCAFPIVWQHHDFNEWNVCRDGHEVRVLDWERARPGPPLADLIYFAANWYFLVRHLRREAERLRAFRALFAGQASEDAYKFACRRAFDRYLAALEIDRAFYPLLLVLTWVVHALDRAERLREMRVGTSSPRANNPYVAYLGILAAQAPQLFPGQAVSCAS